MCRARALASRAGGGCPAARLLRVDSPPARRSGRSVREGAGRGPRAAGRLQKGREQGEPHAQLGAEGRRRRLPHPAVRRGQTLR